MKNISLGLLYLLFSSFTLSAQKIGAYDHMQEKYFEVELPDSLFVVFGERIESSSAFYIDQTEIYLGFDIFLLNEPRTKYVVKNDAFGRSTPKRIDLESAIEVFFAEDYTHDFSLRYNINIYRINRTELFSKFGPVEIIKIKDIKLIFLDYYGDRISAEEFYIHKFQIEYVLKHITLKDSKGNILNKPDAEK